MDLNWSTQVTFVRVMGQIGENSFLLPVGELNTKCYHSVLVGLRLSWWQSFYTTNIFILSLQLLVGFGFFEGEKGDGLGLGSWFVCYCFFGFFVVEEEDMLFFIIFPPTHLSEASFSIVCLLQQAEPPPYTTFPQSANINPLLLSWS